MRIRLTHTAIALGLGLWLGLTGPSLASVARAEDGARPSGSAEYRQLIDHAVKEFGRGNYPEAYSLFERAHAVQPNARTLRGLGLAAFEDRRYVMCIKHLKASLEDPRKPLTESLRAQVEEILERASGFVGRYTLELSPDDAEVSVDSRPATVVNGTLLLNPGEHEIVFSTDGRREVRRVRTRPNETLAMSIDLSDDDPTLEPDSEPSWWTARRTAGLVAASLGVASLATSLALTLKARSERDSAGCVDRICPSEAAKSQAQHARTLGSAATATVVTGAALAAGGATLLLWPSKNETRSDQRSKATTTRVSPALSPWLAGVRVAGTW